VAKLADLLRDVLGGLGEKRLERLLGFALRL